MAEQNKVVFEVEIGGEKRTINSLAEIKKALNDAKNAAINGDGKAAKAVAELNQKLNDLKKSTREAGSSGIENLRSNWGLFREGLDNWDTGKIKASLGGLTQAFKAIPIFLIAEGVRYLIENWNELSEGNGIVAKTLQFVGQIFDEIGDKITEFTDLIGLTNSKLEEQGDLLKTNADKAKEALTTQTAEYDRQITVAKAAGKSTVDLEKAKQKAIIDTNVQVAKQIEAFVRAGGTLDDEKKRLLTASLNAIKDAKVQEYVIEQGHSQKLNEEHAKRLANAEAKKKAEDELRKQRHQKELDELKAQADAEAYLIEKDKLELKQKMEDADALAAYQAEKLNISAQLQEAQSLKEQEDRARERQEYEHDLAQRFAIAQAASTALQGLSDTVFSIRMANVKKGSVEEEKLARKQFQINKGLQLAAAAINGAQAITASLASAPLAIGPLPNPVGIASLIAVSASTAATIAKIASTQFQSSGGGSASSVGSVPSLNSGGGVSNTQAPTTQAQPFTRLDENGNVTQRSQPLKAYVVESEMSDSQKRVSRLEGQASFG